MKHLINTVNMMILLTMTNGCVPPRAVDVQWDNLPSVPDPVGFAGAYAGVSGGSLVVAGGANFPEGTRPWSGGVKQWSDHVFVLGEGSGQWTQVGALPRPMGYGASVTWRDTVIIIGGADQHRHYADVFAMRYADGALQISPMPALPAPIAHTCGVLVGDVIYVAGGLSSPNDTVASAAFFALDLSKPADERQWEVRESWPGAPRMLAVAGSVDGDFYLLSGVSLQADAADAVPVRSYLSDAFRYRPGVGWTAIAGLPHAVAAAPSPALTGPHGQLLVFGGDDGRLARQASPMKDAHPGFSSGIQAYNPLTNQWAADGTLPVDKQANPETDPNASTWAPVTTAAVLWNNRYVLPMGEVRPGVRTNRVLAVKYEAK